MLSSHLRRRPSDTPTCMPRGGVGWGVASNQECSSELNRRIVFVRISMLLAAAQ